MCVCVCVCQLHWPRVKHAKKDPAGRLLIFIWLTLTVCAAAVAPRQRAPPFYVCACARSCLFPQHGRLIPVLAFKVKARNPLRFDQQSSATAAVQFVPKVCVSLKEVPGFGIFLVLRC